MNLDMWFKDDIRNMLIGIEIASAQTLNGLSDAEQMAFRNGFRAALLAVAASFGIVEHEPASLSSVQPARPGEFRRLPQR